MPRNIGRDLNLCFIKIKSPVAICNSSSSSSSDTDHQNRPCAATNSRTTCASANSCSSILLKNFNSLHDDNTADNTSKSLSHISSSLSNISIATASTSFHEAEPDPADFATAFASKRFFFSSPGRSNSIIESTSSTIDCCIYSSATSRSTSSMAVTLPYGRNKKLIIDNSVAVLTYSPDPYVDFRRSMQEMVEAGASTYTLMDMKSKWEFLHELLLCYLALNPQNTHKFIVEAFSDLLVSLMHSQGKTQDSDMAVAVNGDGGE